MKRIIFALIISTGFIVGGALPVKGEQASALSASPIPDWSMWQCRKAHVTHEIIETYGCYGPEENQMSRIVLKLKGQQTPFLIAWGYDAGEKTHAALYKDGKWIAGARGTGFTAEQRSNFVVFYIFLSEDFSIREQLEIETPQAEATEVTVIGAFLAANSK